MRILLGGIPLGCDNIGDEAIIGNVVKILRSLAPQAELTVCTGDRTGTAERLGVKTAPLYLFDPRNGIAEFRSQLAKQDLYIWAGATGLSDYPETALHFLEAADFMGVPSIVWGVGMDSELNPAFYRARGKRLVLLRVLSALTGRKVNGPALYEKWIQTNARKQIAHAFESCRLVVTRDIQTVGELRKCGYTHAEAGADSAILQDSARHSPVMKQAGVRNIGFCISAQRKVDDGERLQALLDRLLEDPVNRLIFIPMNPRTDADLMGTLRSRLKHPEQSILLENCTDPGVIQAVAGNCEVVVSSRLHLLILAANAGTPVIGISRGSKIDSFLANFGMTSTGTVNNCDFDGIYSRIQELTTKAGQERFRQTRTRSYQMLHDRLNRAEHLLKIELDRIGKDKRATTTIAGADL